MPCHSTAATTRFLCKFAAVIVVKLFCLIRAKSNVKNSRRQWWLSAVLVVVVVVDTLLDICGLYLPLFPNVPRLAFHFEALLAGTVAVALLLFGWPLRWLFLAINLPRLIFSPLCSRPSCLVGRAYVIQVCLPLIYSFIPNCSLTYAYGYEGFACNAGISPTGIVRINEK